MSFIVSIILALIIGVFILETQRVMQLVGIFLIIYLLPPSYLVLVMMALGYYLYYKNSQ